MRSSKSARTYRPFENLKDLLEERSFPLASGPGEASVESNEERLSPEEEARLFQEFMADAVPVERDSCLVRESPPAAPRGGEQDPEAESLALLEDLVKGGDGFTISDTAEYMEGIGYGADPEIAKRLHEGDFSIQAHVDLHGMGVVEAHEAFEQFLKEAVISGKRSVLIVHGRGLSSRAEPVLKAKVKEWLTTGSWRKWVVAFTSARSCDGGAGATYVLLRRRPATKRIRKGAKKR
jgi:DNA-nicking Smr family endonuclease